MADPWSGAIHLGQGNWLCRDLDPAGYTEAEKAGILEALAAMDEPDPALESARSLAIAFEQRLEEVRRHVFKYKNASLPAAHLAVEVLRLISAPLAVVTTPGDAA